VDKSNNMMDNFYDELDRVFISSGNTTRNFFRKFQCKSRERRCSQTTCREREFTWN